MNQIWVERFVKIFPKAGILISVLLGIYFGIYDTQIDETIFLFLLIGFAIVIASIYIINPKLLQQKSKRLKNPEKMQKMNWWETSFYGYSRLPVLFIGLIIVGWLQLPITYLIIAFSLWLLVVVMTELLR